MALIFAPILFIAVIIYVAYPFLATTAEAVMRERAESELEKVLKEKEDVMTILKDIEMDFRMGKLSDSDYQNLKLQHEEDAVRILQQLEQLDKKDRRAGKTQS